jgi:pimeloyl-ACP methyl ester carboxylesterase
MVRTSVLFSFLFCISFIPVSVFADFEIPPPPDVPVLPEVTFTLNDAEADADISSTSPSASVAVVFSEEVYVTRVYICAESVDPCNQGSATKYFSPNATTTAYTTEWSGEVSGEDNVVASAGVYNIIVRFYHYESDEEVYEETAPYSITILDEPEPEEEPLPPTVEFSVVGTTISSSTPSIDLSVSSSEAVLFESIYICPETAIVCDNSSHTERIEINATSTATTTAWHGSRAIGGSAPAGAYQAVLHYFAYAVSPEVFTLSASSTIAVLAEEQVDDSDGGGEPPPPPAPSYTLINSNLASNQTWTKEGSPYVVEGAISVQQHRALTIEAGVVVKFKEGATLYAHARSPVHIQGTADEPVIFTSFKDDSAGGDTNADGDATVPAPGDWGYANFGGGSSNNVMHLSHLKVHYGGGMPFTYTVSYQNPQTVYPALILFYPWYQSNPGVGYSLEHIEVAHSADIGLHVHVGRNNSLTISNSSFFHNQNFGVRKSMSYGAPKNSDQTGSVNLSGNWWGDASGPYHESLSPEGEGSAIWGTKLTLDSWLESDPFEAATPERYDCCSSVIFLPGFQGSILKSGDNTLWPPTFGDVSGDLDKLAFEDGEPVTENVTVHGILETFYTKPIYEGFTNFLNTLAGIDTDSGTSTIKTWESFAYDWRYGPDDIVDMSDWIAGIEQLAEDSFTGKVTLVAHSYGGLVGKALIKRLADEGKADLVESFVMVGTPQLGTPQAVTALLHGDGAEIKKNVEVKLLSFYTNFDVVLVTKKDARNLGLTLDGAHYLLPSAEYFNRILDPVVTFNPGLPGSLVSKWHSSYDHNGITTYSDLSDFLRAERVPRTKNPEVLESSLLTKAHDWHEVYDTFSYPSDMRVVQIAGWGLPTIKGIEYLGDRRGTNDVLLTTEGDKTVVYPSAVASDEEVYYFNLESFDAFENYVDHTDILSAFPIHNFIEQFVKDSSLDAIDYLTIDKPTPTDENDKLIVSVHSPVTLGVTDQFGNYTGITPGQDPDADILFITTDIPGSSYFTVGDAKYITLLENGIYTFVMSGTDEGDVTVIIETLSDGDNQTTTATYNFMVSASSSANFSIVDGTAGELMIDQDGDGSVDETVLSDEEQALQEEGEETKPASTETSSVSSGGGGGGVIWNSSTTTPKVQETDTPTTTPALTSSVEPEEKGLEETETVTVQLVAPQTQTQTQVQDQEEKAVSSSTPTDSLQTASTIQSGWYDKFISFIKNLFEKLAHFLNSLLQV